MLQKSKMQQQQSNTAELYCPNNIQYLTILVRYKLLFFLVRSPKAISIRRHSQTFKTRGIQPPCTLLLLLLPYYRHFWKFFIPLSLLTTWFVHVPNLNPTCPPVARSYIFYYSRTFFMNISQVILFNLHFTEHNYITSIPISQRFAMDGLRTLVLCTRDLTEQEFNAWKAAHHNAAIAIGKCNFHFYENKKKNSGKKIYM